MHQSVKYEPLEIFGDESPRGISVKRRWTVGKMGTLLVLAIITLLIVYNCLLWYFDAFHLGTVAPPSIGAGQTALVLVAHDREEYLSMCLDSLREARGIDGVKLVVSMDDPSHYGVLKETVRKSGFEDKNVVFVENEMFLGTWFFHTSDDRITHHYKKIFEAVFDQMKFEYAIVLETDLTVSPDFIEYMMAGQEILDKEDPNLFCVSGWNDNGFDHLGWREERLMRTDLFPGLGWMMKRNMWTDILSREWPTRFGNYAYDIWLRYSASTHTRDCIVPEVSRTHHVAKYGSHVNGNGYTTYESMLLASGEVKISRDEFQDVADVTEYEKRIREEALENVRRIRPFDLDDYEQLPDRNILVIVSEDDYYFDWGYPSEFETVTSYFGLFSSSFRSAHKGLLSFRRKDSTKYITILMEEYMQHWGIQE